MAKQRQDPSGSAEDKSPDRSEPVKVRIKKLWTGKRGVFAPGCIVELPLDVALSLKEEGAAEIVEEEGAATVEAEVPAS